MAWIWLVVAGLFEVGFTTCMKLSDQFSKPLPSIGFLICATLSFILLNRSLSAIPLGTAYAVWTGIGAFGTVLVNAIFFREPLGPVKLLFLCMIVGGVAGLKMFSK